jgi:hypothetical protein
MKTIKIGVNKQIDGYTFSLSPSLRKQIKESFPEAYPASIIFVGYDTQSGFECFLGKLEEYIYPALIGVKNDDLRKIFNEVEFVDNKTDEVIYTQQI